MSAVAFPLSRSELEEQVRRALREDAPWGDLTTQALIAPDIIAAGAVVVREPGIICGLPVAEGVFRSLAGDHSIKWTLRVPDGEAVEAGTTVATVQGAAGGLLTGERLALNFLQRLSGIATLAATYVAAIQGTGARLVDTRKTTPGLRSLEKYAVRSGGAANHRYGLSDAVLIKDNHIAILQQQGLALQDVVRLARTNAPHTVRIEVEVDHLSQIEEALAGGADIILLDNMQPEQLREAVRLIAGRAITEASGGISLTTVRTIAETGVDLISVGALTHSARSLDIALDFA